MAQPLTVDQFVEGILNQDRVMLSRAITLVESTRTDHRQQANKIVNACLPYTGKAIRIGITGAPGVGKSTFIDALGTHLLANNHTIAVLAIDPSSSRTRGSILGDKTRMAKLSQHPDVFIRPSPSSGTLGGIANRTREVILLCEAAGFSHIFVETVGVGQSEFSVHQMVDMLLLLIITGAGDDLQGIKRGIMEMADLIVINKADGPNTSSAKQLLRLIRQATHILPESRPQWQTQVTTASSTENTGMDGVTQIMQDFLNQMQSSGAFAANRKQQSLDWMHQHIQDRLLQQLSDNETVVAQLPLLEKGVSEGTLTPLEAADKVIEMLWKR